MKKHLSAYAPSLGELWLIMLALLCAGGSLLSGIVAVILSHFVSIDLVSLSLALYPLQFVWAIPFILIRAKNSYNEKTLRGIPVFQKTPASFGSIPKTLFFVLLLVLVPAFIIVTEPLTAWMKMPDFIKDLFGAIGNQGWISVLSLVIMAPLLEEWLCRGIALNGLLNNGYSPAAAIAWSAFMFGVIHMNPWQAIPAFFLGLLFGWIFWRTRSLWSVIFMHAITNGLSVTLTWAFPHIPDDAATYDIVGPRLYGWILAGSLVVTVSIIWLFFKKLSPAAPLFKRASQDRFTAFAIKGEGSAES